MKEIIRHRIERIIDDLKIALTDEKAIWKEQGAEHNVSGGKTLTQDIIKDMTAKDLFSLKMKTETSNTRITKVYNKLWEITNIRNVADFDNLLKTLDAKE
mgnify:CR=1 FL=1|tara:strand:+ start:54 stop:353 length:300 start_codon:yes stop_codon:yes gene_type:complete